MVMKSEEGVKLYAVGGRSDYVHRINRRPEYHHSVEDSELDDDKFQNYFRLIRD